MEPSGRFSVVHAENHEQAIEHVNALQEKWDGYCERNWLNDTGDLYTPEFKVKTFLDSLAYFLLLGYTEGIETIYKRVMHAKREIPASSCPSYIDNLFYSSGVANDKVFVEENTAFKRMLESLDEKAAPYEPKKIKKKERSLFHKKMKNGIRNGQWYPVDTDGKFWVGNNEYVIDDQEIQYQPIETDYSDYYAMDRILCANGKFYDMNYDEVQVHAIGGIVQYEVFGTEN